jgi:hypothetical protein
LQTRHPGNLWGGRHKVGRGPARGRRAAHAFSGEEDFAAITSHNPNIMLSVEIAGNSSLALWRRKLLNIKHLFNTQIRQPRTRVEAREDFFPWIRYNPLKRPESTKRIQGNASLFAWILLVLFGFIWLGLALRLH